MHQIKNIVSTAYALASQKRDRVAMSHLEVAIAAGEDFECDFKGAGQVGNMQSYVYLSPTTGYVRALLLVCTHSLFGMKMKTGGWNEESN